MRQLEPSPSKFASRKLVIKPVAKNDKKLALPKELELSDDEEFDAFIDSGATVQVAKFT